MSNWDKEVKLPEPHVMGLIVVSGALLISGLIGYAKYVAYGRDWRCVIASCRIDKTTEAKP